MKYPNPRYLLRKSKKALAYVVIPALVGGVAIRTYNQMPEGFKSFVWCVGLGTTLLFLGFLSLICTFEFGDTFAERRRSMLVISTDRLTNDFLVRTVCVTIWLLTLACFFVIISSPGSALPPSFRSDSLTTLVYTWYSVMVGIAGIYTGSKLVE